jgi:hypothetical protein
MNNRLWFIRDNRIDIAQGSGIWIDTYSYTGDMEVSYNLVKVTTGNTALFGQVDEAYGPITSFRNTYIGAPVRVDNLFGTNGPVKFIDDVIVTTSSENEGFEGYNNQNLSLLVKTGVIWGTKSAGIVDTAGNLSGSYAGYVGRKGYQVTGGSVTVPRPPVAFAIE